MIYNFIEEFSDIKINDEFDMFLMNDLESKFLNYALHAQFLEYPTLEDYQEKCINKLGVEA